jgi:hypothetical protein
MESARMLLLYPLSASQETLVPGWVTGGAALAETVAGGGLVSP